MIVDDEPNVTAAIERLLASEHDTVALTSPRAALDLISRGEQFDVILCDLAMPELSGQEMYEELCRGSPDASSRFAFITGGAHSRDTESFLARTGTRCLEKPFTPEALRKAVGEMLG